MERLCENYKAEKMMVEGRIGQDSRLISLTSEYVEHFEVCFCF